MRPVGDTFFRADRRTDMTKLLVVFYNFANASKSVFIGYRYNRL